MATDFSQLFQTDFSSTYGGFNPSYADYITRQSQMQNQSQWVQQIMRSDPRAQLMTQMWQNTMGAPTGTSEEIARSTNRQLLMAGALANSRQMTGMFGGSRVDLFAGIASGVGNRVHSVTGAGGESVFYGQGRLTSLASQQLLQEMEGTMYSPYGGAMGNRTFGLNRSQMGSIAGYAGATGAMSGLKMEARQIGRSNVEQEISRATGEGDDMYVDKLKKLRDELYQDTDQNRVETVLRVTKKDRQKAMEVFSQYAEVVGELKDLMGDVTDNELLSAVEGLAGFRGAGQAKAAQSRLREIKSMASIGGGSTQGYMSLFGDMTASLRDAGFGSQQASQLARDNMMGMVTKKNFASQFQTAMGDQGFVVKDMTEAALKERALDQVAYFQENPRVATALYAIQNSEKLSEADRTALLSQVEQSMQVSADLSPAAAAAERRRKQGDMASLVESSTGVSMNMWDQRADGKALEKLQGSYSATANRMGRHEMNRRAIRQLGGLYTDADQRTRAMDLVQKYSASTILKMSEEATTDEEKGFLRSLSIQIGTDDRFAGIVSAEEQAAADTTNFQEMRKGITLGLDKKTTKSLMGGFFGEKTITDDMKMKALLYGKGEHPELLDTTGMSEREITERVRSIQDAGGGVGFDEKTGKYFKYTAEQMQQGEDELLNRRDSYLGGLLGTYSSEDIATMKKDGTLGETIRARAALLASEGEVGSLEELSTLQDAVGSGGVAGNFMMNAVQTEIKKLEGQDKRTKEEDSKLARLKDAREKLETKTEFDPKYFTQRIIELLELLVSKFTNPE
jgi:hypothetical protein